jgi:hypothetical protein
MFRKLDGKSPESVIFTLTHHYQNPLGTTAVKYIPKTSLQMYE